MPILRWITRRIDLQGRLAMGFVRHGLNLLTMVYLSAKAALVEQPQGLAVVMKVVAAQIYFSGCQAIPLIGILALATGGLVILNTPGQVSGGLFYAVVIREIGPLLTALVVIARSGTAVASELGNMKVNREMDALQVMGIDPLSFVVFPRIVGGVVSVVCLVCYFDGIAIAGGYVMSHYIEGVSLEFFLKSLSYHIALPDIGWMAVKSVAYGLTLFSIACYQGSRVQQSAHRVPQVTTQAVVLSIGSVTLLNVAMTALWQVVAVL